MVTVDESVVDSTETPHALTHSSVPPSSSARTCPAVASRVVSAPTSGHVSGRAMVDAVALPTDTSTPVEMLTLAVRSPMLTDAVPVDAPRCVNSDKRALKRERLVHRQRAFVAPLDRDDLFRGVRPGRRQVGLFGLWCVCGDPGTHVAQNRTAAPSHATHVASLRVTTRRTITVPGVPLFLFGWFTTI